MTTIKDNIDAFHAAMDYAANPPTDRRYEHVDCAACGQRWQRIDWGSAPHRLRCEAAASPPGLNQ